MVAVSVDRAGGWHSTGNRLALCPGEGLLACDVVFPALYGPFGENGTVQGLLELLDVPYIGAGVFASSLCADKAAFKDALAASGVPQVRYVVVRESHWRRAQEAVHTELAGLDTPVFVKPARLGSSVGIVRVTDPERLDAALETAFSHDGVAVVEECCSGVEVECGVIGLTEPEISVPSQIVRRGSAVETPAPLPAAVCAEVQRLARETYLRVGCEGLAQVDFVVDGSRVLVTALNTLPGFAPTSAFPKLWEASGLPLPALCERLIEFAVDRFHSARRGTGARGGVW